MLIGMIIICAVILYSLTQGAPYVPTRRKETEQALRLMRLPSDALVVDMGAGDGSFLKTAVEQGHRAAGIELNPLLYMVAKLRLRRFGGRARIVRGNMWRWQLPTDTDGIFLFTAGPFAERMAKHLQREQKRLNHELVVVSLGFELPGLEPVGRSGACIKYILK